MSSPVVVMVSVSERVPSLNRFMESLVKREPGIPIFIHLQDPDGRSGEIEVPKGLEAEVRVTPEPLGCHAARVRALQMLDGQGYDRYVNVDDDVILTPMTDWRTALDYTGQPGVGFVLTNWCMHLSQYAKRKDSVTRKVTPQVMVYQGGGMAYGEAVADLMRDLPAVPARYDDIWPLTAYLHGYANYRYSGSLSVHEIRSRGGMSAYMGAEPRPLLCWEWIDYRLIPGAKVGREYAIPMDSDLRPAAREEHVRARTAAGWPMRTAKHDAHPALEKETP